MYLYIVVGLSRYLSRNWQSQHVCPLSIYVVINVAACRVLSHTLVLGLLKHRVSIIARTVLTDRNWVVEAV
jgi:hypothetical protein